MSRQDRVGWLRRSCRPFLPGVVAVLKCWGGGGSWVVFWAAECLHLHSLRGGMGTGDPPAPQILQNPEL